MCYLASSWLSNIGQGLIVTVVGPSQPYIAKNVGVDIATINLLWSFQFFGFLLGSIASGFVFKRLEDGRMVKKLSLKKNEMITIK